MPDDSEAKPGAAQVRYFSYFWDGPVASQSWKESEDCRARMRVQIVLRYKVDSWTVR